MLGDQDPADFRKPLCLIGESVFFDPKFGVNYELAHWFKNHGQLHELLTFAYVVEPVWRVESLDLKKHRLMNLRAYGCPFIEFPMEYGLSIIQLLRTKPEYIYAPALFDAAKKLSSTAILHNSTWVMESAPTTEARISALHYLVEARV